MMHRAERSRPPRLRNYVHVLAIVEVTVDPLLWVQCRVSAVSTDLYTLKHKIEESKTETECNISPDTAILLFGEGGDSETERGVDKKGRGGEGGQAESLATCRDNLRLLSNDAMETVDRVLVKAFEGQKRVHYCAGRREGPRMQWVGAWVACNRKARPIY